MKKEIRCVPNVRQYVSPKMKAGYFRMNAVLCISPIEGDTQDYDKDDDFFD